jgi:hypothetical protein
LTIENRKTADIHDAGSNGILGFREDVTVDMAN